MEMCSGDRAMVGAFGASFGDVSGAGEDSLRDQGRP